MRRWSPHHATSCMRTNTVAAAPKQHTQQEQSCTRTGSANARNKQQAAREGEGSRVCAQCTQATHTRALERTKQPQLCQRRACLQASCQLVQARTQPVICASTRPPTSQPRTSIHTSVSLRKKTTPSGALNTCKRTERSNKRFYFTPMGVQPCACLCHIRVCVCTLPCKLAHLHRHTTAMLVAEPFHPQVLPHPRFIRLLHRRFAIVTPPGARRSLHRR